ncbi:hypothetical protein OM999_01975 [Mycoplasmopsis cynos]|nr:hypothetical protein OM999_01975 [Mycoplasmopsis cynos]
MLFFLNQNARAPTIIDNTVNVPTIAPVIIPLLELVLGVNFLFLSLASGFLSSGVFGVSGVGFGFGCGFGFGFGFGCGFGAGLD